MQSQKSKVKTQNSANNSSKATSMADLMKSVKTTLVTFRKGEKLVGRITKLTPSEILVDINAKTEAVVLEKDKRILRSLLSNLHVGDKVTVSILNPESDTGNPVVSLRRHIDEMLWKQLETKQKNQEKIIGIVKEVTRGGLLVDTDFGLYGFLPNSQITISPKPDEILEKKIEVFVLEQNRAARKIILSQKITLGEKEFEDAVKNLKVGQKIDAIVANVASFGVFVFIQVKENLRLDGLVHISEISWEETRDGAGQHPAPNGAGFTQGQVIQCVVIGIDREAKRVDLSIKRLHYDPFEEVIKQISLDQKVEGRVLRQSLVGVFVELEPFSQKALKMKVEGLIRKEKIPIGASYEVGDEVVATVSQIDTKRRRLILVPVLKEKPIGYK